MGRTDQEPVISGSDFKEKAVRRMRMTKSSAVALFCERLKKNGREWKQLRESQTNFRRSAVEQENRLV